MRISVFSRNNQNPFLKRIPFITVALGIAIFGTIALLATHAQGTSTISGIAFDDANRNGVFDAGETGFANKQINVFSDATGAYVANGVTDASGNYSVGGLEDGSYRVAWDTTDWQTMRQDWTPTTTGSLQFSKTVTLQGTVSADFGLRKIVRSTDINAPLSSYKAASGLVVRSYNDAVSADSIYTLLSAGSLVNGREAAVSTIYFDYGTSTDCSVSVGGVPGSYTGYSASMWLAWLPWLENSDRALFHEYGHAWSLYNDYMVQQEGNLSAYLTARGLSGDARVNTSYTWDAREMIAEDYRELFGTPNAAAYPQANPDIPLAKDVPGLQDWLANTFTKAPAAALTAPANLTVKAASQSEIDVSWSGESGAVKYNVYRNGSLAGFTNAPSTTYADVNLAASTGYAYYVKVVDSTGKESPASSTVSATTLAADITPPSAPVNLKASTVTASSVGLTWSASTDNIGVAGYKIYQINGTRKGTYSSLIATTQNTSYTVSGLSAAGSYSYYVAAYDAAGNQSASSNTLNVKTLRK